MESSAVTWAWMGPTAVIAVVAFFWWMIRNQDGKIETLRSETGKQQSDLRKEYDEKQTELREEYDEKQAELRHDSELKAAKAHEETVNLWKEIARVWEKIAALDREQAVSQNKIDTFASSLQRIEAKIDKFSDHVHTHPAGKEKG